jgi:peptide/nickel transport system permease protein
MTFPERRISWMGLRAFVIRRLLLVVPTLIGVTLLIFAVGQLIPPSQRAYLYVGEIPKGPDVIDKTIVKYHLNESVVLQYSGWMQLILQGNLGYSYYGRGMVTDLIREKAPATAEIVIFSAPIIILVGIYLGVKSAVHRDKPLDHATRTISIVGYSLPSFWLGILLLAFFFAFLGWFPPGRISTDVRRFVYGINSDFIQYTGMMTVDGILNGQLWVTRDAIEHLVLPVTVISIINIAAIVRVMRSSMLESLNKSYIIMAKSKGLDKNEVINKHARRNALIPVITLSGMMIAGMLNGLVITETVFNFEGLGGWAAGVAMQFDLPAVLGFALFSGVIFVAANLIVDVLYAYIDPRIRLG